jgi:Uncharacterized protein conserved in bacteria
MRTMTQGQPTLINEILSGPLRQGSPLIDQVLSLEHWSRQLLARLPTPLRDHCRVVGVKDDQLVLLADASVWSYRLRFHIPDLQVYLTQHLGLKVRTVCIRVSPPESRPPPPPRRRPILSQRAAKLLAQTAATIRHPALRAALLRLSQRAT